MVATFSRNLPTLRGWGTSFGGRCAPVADRPEVVDLLPTAPSYRVLHHGALAPLLVLATRDLAWLAVVVPLVVLVQMALIRLRNRLRDRIHGPTTPATAPTPTPTTTMTKTMTTPSGSELETVIGEELRVVFDDPSNPVEPSVDGSDDEAQRRARLVELAETVADRADDRLELSDRERATLRTTLTAAVLDAFGHPPSALPDRGRSEAVELRGGVVEDLPEGRVVE